MTNAEKEALKAILWKLNGVVVTLEALADKGSDDAEALRLLAEVVGNNISGELGKLIWEDEA